MDLKKWKSVCGNRACDFKTDDARHNYCPLCGNLLLSKKHLGLQPVCSAEEICGLYDSFDEACSRHEIKFQCIKTILMMLESLDFSVRQLRIGLQSQGWKPPTREELLDTNKGRGYATVSKERMSDIEGE